MDGAGKWFFGLAITAICVWLLVAGIFGAVAKTTSNMAIMQAQQAQQERERTAQIETTESHRTERFEAFLVFMATVPPKVTADGPPLWAFVLVGGFALYAYLKDKGAI